LHCSRPLTILHALGGQGLGVVIALIRVALLDQYESPVSVGFDVQLENRLPRRPRAGEWVENDAIRTAPDLNDLLDQF